MMNFRELVAGNRTVRRFDQSRTITMAELEQLSELACMTASGGNVQPIRHVLVADPEMNQKVFDCLGWAAYLPQWPGPDEGERPAAYVVLCMDAESAKTPQVDVGIQAQTMMLGARAMGLGCCMFGSVNREKLAEAITPPPGIEILFVLALGSPAEEVVMEELAPGGSVKYWRDAEGKHHVPKRTIGEVVISRFGA